MKLALVTAGYHRLGAAIAARLAADGWTLALHSRRPDEPEPALRAQLGEWRGFVADLSDERAVEALIPAIASAFGEPPALLVNNASLFTDDDADSATLANLHRHAAVNAQAPAALALALGRTGVSGAVVNIVDQRVRNPVPDQLSYSLSKAALAAATRTLAVALAPRIRVNAVAPGLTLPTPDYKPGQMERIAGMMPLRRLAAPSDIAEAVTFLAGAQAVTGQTLFVDGGASLTGFARDFSAL